MSITLDETIRGFNLFIIYGGIGRCAWGTILRIPKKTAQY